MRMRAGFVNYRHKHKENTLNTIIKLFTKPFKYKTKQTFSVTIFDDFETLVLPSSREIPKARTL